MASRYAVTVVAEYVPLVFLHSEYCYMYLATHKLYPHNGPFQIGKGAKNIYSQSHSESRLPTE